MSTRHSPPNSPLESHGHDELGYNLQLDYWSSCATTSTPGLTSTFSTPSMVSSMNQHLLRENLFNKSNKNSIKALFKSMHIYRTNFVKTTSATTGAGKSNLSTGLGSSNSSETDPNNTLTIIYLIKEKKQKSML